MSNIKFESFQAESQVANTGGLVSRDHAGKSVKLKLVRQWTKDGKDRTSGGKGSLGVITSEGWMNASQLIDYLGKLDANDPTRKDLIAGTEGAYELIIDTTKVIELSFDLNSRLTKVSTQFDSAPAFTDEQLKPYLDLGLKREEAIAKLTEKLAAA